MPAAPVKYPQRIYEEFIFGGRLDNQVGAYCAIKAIIESAENISDETGKLII